MNRLASERGRLPRDIVDGTGAWAEIGAAFGTRLVADVIRVLRTLPPGIDAAHTAAATELFFAEVAAAMRGAGREDVALLAPVSCLYSNRKASPSDHEAGIQAVTVAFEQWRKNPTPTGAKSGVTAYAHGLGAGRILEGLGNLPDRHYPAFKRPKLPVPRPEGDAPTLGILPWPELEGMDPLARERVALLLVSRALNATFDDRLR